MLVIANVEDAGESEVCEFCKGMNGRLDGDGWNSALGKEGDLWRKNEMDVWIRLDTDGVFGSPPFHKHCRCRVVVAEELRGETRVRSLMRRRIAKALAKHWKGERMASDVPRLELLGRIRKAWE